MITDTNELRELLTALLPGLAISAVPASSGQRVVYFAYFDPETSRAAGIDDEVIQTRISWGEIVVKVSSGIAASQITYLQREIEILGKLKSRYFPALHYHNVYSHHPNTEEPINRIFLTIEEKIDGEPLSNLMAHYASPLRATDFLIDLITGGDLLWSHKPSIVHRDLKPANILIRTDGGICIIDLGIARIEGADGVTNTHAIFGPCTPGYSSPEQARNDKLNINYKSDFFSIGIIAYELLSGVNPFAPNKNTPILDILTNVQTVVPTPLGTSIGTPTTLSNLVDSLLMKEPYQRPRSPAHLLLTLQEVRSSLNGD